MFRVKRVKANYVQEIGLLELDIDQNATRVLIQNRENQDVIWHSPVTNNPIISITTPLQYTVDPLLMVTIFDDGKNGAPPQFNAETVDRVQASLPGTGE
ncbi:hypothetical protein [Pseudoalteromonas piscicida]|uniref:hypothetical protein n=1 Tax=Pseudoalteromonas piscicida TaxID=43662 RepID=UPI0005FA2342|nr:hypothetical protein [Pseudoalteromonas piscicida]KJZ03291.1 hypothetical protein TW73_09095 [Pseudoalteromonas piscicida]